MSETTEIPNLKFAKDLVNYLGCQNLPKELIDDRKKRVDWEKRTEDELTMAHFNEDSLFKIKTVRFLKDFARYKAAPDLKTTNTSFLRTAEIFRQQGIKNYYFLLQLNNPALVGVDPYDENLTHDQKLMVMHECETNFWYFLREVCKLRPDRQFLANRGNISFIWSYLNHITTYMIMPRQQGKYQDDNNKVRIKPKGRADIPDDMWAKIGSLQLGDEVIDRYGNVCNVIGVHPQGLKRLYRVYASDGRYVDAGPEHLWTMGDHSRKVNEEPIWDDYTTAEMLTKHNQKVKMEFPLIDPELGKKKTLAIDPYVMGTLVSGSRVGGKIVIRKVSEQADEYIQANLPDGLELICKGSRRTIQMIEEGKEIVFDPEMGVPAHYLEGALQDRLTLLQAFLDQGVITEEGVAYRSASRIISGHIQYLARGLGGTALKANGKVTVTLPNTLGYFKFKHSTEDEWTFPNQLFVDRIEYLGEAPCTCIEVDNEEHLYVTDDFLVTHNTVSVQVIKFWLTFIMGRGYKSHLVTLKSDNRAQFIDAIKKIRTCLPKYLVNPTYKDKDAGTYLTYKAFGDDQVNTLTISVPQMGEAAAGDLGRGLTVGTTNYDEPGYISWIESIINGCSPSALTEMELCREAGIPYGINYITTPNTTLHPSGAFMFEKLMSSTEWREKFFDSYSESHLKARLLRASPKKTTSPSVAMVYNYLQLGKDKEWVKETIDSLGLSLAKAKIDLLLMWVEDGENRLFDDITREAINNVKRDKVWSKEFRSSGLFVDFFVTQQQLMEMGKKEHNDYFLIGVDTSQAINKDACTLIIRSMRSGKVIGVGRFALAFLDDVTAIIVDMLETLNNSLLIIERNYAHHMIDNLLIMLPAKGMDPFTRIYNTVFQDPVNNPKEYEAVQHTKFAHRTKNFYLKYKQYFGFNTTSTSRQVLYGLIQEAVGITGYGINYDRLADELINLRTKSDRIDHDTKQHDDLVIAWLLTYWFIKLGANKPMYGIPTGIALTDTRNLLEVGKTKNAPDVDPSILQFVDSVRTRVAKLTDELLNTNDNILAMRLEAEIHKLTKLLPVETVKLLTVDDLLADAKLQRNKRMLQNRRAA
jgi:hypothetical protein